MKCIIVDDNKMARTAIRLLIEQVDFLELKKECENPIEAFNYLKSEEVDLVFLDVEMPGMTGVELLKNLEKRPIVILVTSKKDYAIEAFELNVADYIIKPVDLPRFTKAIARAKELYESRQPINSTVKRTRSTSLPVQITYSQKSGLTILNIFRQWVIMLIFSPMRSAIRYT